MLKGGGGGVPVVVGVPVVLGVPADVGVPGDVGVPVVGVVGVDPDRLGLAGYVQPDTTVVGGDVETEAEPAKSQVPLAWPFL